MPSDTVLVVDDESEIRNLVSTYLTREGYKVIEAADGEQAVLAFRRHLPAVVILDLRLPGIDGYDVLREISSVSDAYVIVLSARGEESDKLIGLELGADDYVTKPFSPRELTARVKAVLRRGRSSTPPPQEDRHFAGLTISLARREVTVDGTQVELTSLEFDLLSALSAAPGRVFSRQQLIEKVWGRDFYGDERVVDVHVRNLRRSLGDQADSPRFVGTVRGVGYKLVASEVSV